MFIIDYESSIKRILHMNVLPNHSSYNAFANEKEEKKEKKNK